jgi:hypothetical protein
MGMDISAALGAAAGPAAQAAQVGANAIKAHAYPSIDLTKKGFI